jgi:hypothetical protein
VTDAFGEVFRQERGEPYRFIPSKDGPAAARLAKFLAANPTDFPEPIETVRERAKVYFDKKFTKENHVGFAHFASDFQSCIKQPLIDPDRFRDV